MRKLWFAQPAQALIVSRRLCTMDRCLSSHPDPDAQNGASRDHSSLRLKVLEARINFGWLLESGTISSEDLKLIRFVDTPQQAFGILKDELGSALACVNPQAPVHLRGV